MKIRAIRGDEIPGPQTGEFKVLKGGSWGSSTLRSLEVDTRAGCRPEYISNGTGFRLAMDAEGVELLRLRPAATHGRAAD